MKIVMHKQNRKLYFGSSSDLKDFNKQNTNLHNWYGPSFLTKEGKSYRKNGRLHNIYGPAVKSFIIKYFEYWLDGKNYFDVGHWITARDKYFKDMK